jgi:hypothetical protein
VRPCGRARGVAGVGVVYQAPQECVGSQTRDRGKREPGRVEKVADPAIFNQSTGKSVFPARAVCARQGKHTKSKSLLHLSSTG